MTSVSPGWVAQWRRALPPGSNGAVADHAAIDLVSRWAQPHRHYHGLAHLTSVLSVIDDHADHADRVELVRLAAWFHDAVYDPRRGDNEDASAALAETVLRRLGLAAPGVAEVARLVRLTAAHHPRPGDNNGELLCDADLSVLAAPPDEYLRYTHRIRSEYGHVSSRAFRAGRVAILRRLLALPALYRVPVLHEQWEERARTNLRTELTTLT